MSRTPARRRASSPTSPSRMRTAISRPWPSSAARRISRTSPPRRRTGSRRTWAISSPRRTRRSPAIPTSTPARRRCSATPAPARRSRPLDPLRRPLPAPDRNAAPTAVPRPRRPLRSHARARGASARPGRGDHATGSHLLPDHRCPGRSRRLPDAGGLLPEPVCRERRRLRRQLRSGRCLPELLLQLLQRQRAMRRCARSPLHRRRLRLHDRNPVALRRRTDLLRHDRHAGWTGYLPDRGGVQSAVHRRRDARATVGCRATATRDWSAARVANRSPVARVPVSRGGMRPGALHRPGMRLQRRRARRLRYRAGLLPGRRGDPRWGRDVPARGPVRASAVHRRGLRLHRRCPGELRCRAGLLPERAGSPGWGRAPALPRRTARPRPARVRAAPATVGCRAPATTDSSAA